MTNQKTKSPLKAKPLRNPGQSLDEEIEKLIDDKISTWLLAVLYFFAIAAFEWIRWYTQAPYNPKALTLLAVIVGIFGFFKLRKFRLQLKRLRLGRDGEKAVGQYLEGLRQKGYRVFHDVKGESFNIDHVLIGRTGVYTIETKTFSKPTDHNAKITFDGEVITKDGMRLDRDPVVQARAQASWLSELLEESTGRKCRARPVVLFPGWYVESGWQEDLWVLNPKGLSGFLDRQETQLTDEEKGIFSFHLSRFVRSE